MAYETVKYSKTDDVVTIAFNRPESLESMTVRVGRDLYDALCEAKLESRATVVSTMGEEFCSGADLSEANFDFSSPCRDAGSGPEPIINPILMQMRKYELPVITAVQGAAARVGCGIALAGDVIVASEDACFFQAFAKVGLVPDGGSTYLTARAIGGP